MKRRIAVHKIPQNFLPSRQRTRGGAWFNKWPNRGERETQRNDAKWIAGDVRNPTSSSNRLYSPFEVVNDSFHLADGYTRHWRGVCCSNMKKKEGKRQGRGENLRHTSNQWATTAAEGGCKESSYYADRRGASKVQKETHTHKTLAILQVVRFITPSFPRMKIEVVLDAIRVGSEAGRYPPCSTIQNCFPKKKKLVIIDIVYFWQKRLGIIDGQLMPPLSSNAVVSTREEEKGEIL